MIDQVLFTHILFATVKTLKQYFLLGADHEEKTCNLVECEVDQIWSDWSNWSDCDDSDCKSKKLQFRRRNCQSPNTDQCQG